MNHDERIAYLERDGGAVPCSRWGRNSEECAPVAMRLLELFDEANGAEGDERENLDHYMGLVVNDHDNVITLLRDHGTAEDHRMWFDELGFVDRARDIGAEEGKNAAAWWAQDAIGGRTTGDAAADTATRVLRGLDDGDPEILDALPSADLSGEWADGKLDTDVASETGFTLDENPSWSDMANVTVLADAYVDAFNEAAQEEVERLCRDLIQPENVT